MWKKLKMQREKYYWLEWTLEEVRGYVPETEREDGKDEDRRNVK